jgi:hypothetical protein
MKHASEAELFDAGMERLLKADPKVVQAAMDAEKKDRAAERKAKRSSPAPASSTRDA